MQTDISKIDYWELPEIKEPIHLDYDLGSDLVGEWIAVNIVYTYMFESAKGSKMHYVNYRRTVRVYRTKSYNAALQAILQHFKNDSLLGIYVYDKLVSPELLNQNF